MASDNISSPDTLNIFSELSDNYVDDDALNDLNFDLDFDAVAESMGDALPNIDLGEMGSLGTRSPSPSGSASAYSMGSKRSRAEFDSESECDSERYANAKRMVFHSGPESNFSFGQPYQDEDYATKVIQRDREREGRCHQCGLETHKLVMSGLEVELQPLSIVGEVLNGRCLLCDPLPEGEIATVDREYSPDGGSELGASKSKQTPQPPPRGNNTGPNMSNRPPPPQQHQWQSLRNEQTTPNLPFHQDALSRRAGKFTPTPNQFHSKMALAKQAQLPRKHSAIDHARLKFGETNNRRPVKSNARRTYSGSGMPEPPPLGEGNGMWAQLTSDQCSVSRADGNYSRASHYSHNRNSSKSGGAGTAIKCTETIILDSEHQSSAQQQLWSMSPHPQTPHSLNRSSSGPPSRSSLTQVPQAQTPSSNRAALRTPQSFQANINNTPRNLPTGGSGGNITPKSVSSIQDLPTSMGTVPQAVRLAHSKLKSSIYHHHIFPMDEDMERAHVEKTLIYLESGGGDICDIVVAMRRFPFSLAVQRSACEKLYAHCFDQEHAHAIGLVGGIRTIIDAMEHHPNDAKLLQACTDVMKQLAMASQFNTDMLDRMGSVGIIISTMERHPKNAALLESCCWAMERLTQSPSPELKLRWAKGGGIHAAMKAVETFPNNESLLRAAFHCLRQLGYNPSSYGSNKQSLPQQQRQTGSNPQPQHISSNSSVRNNGGGNGGGAMPLPRGGGVIGANIMHNMHNNYMMGENLLMGNGSNNPMMSNLGNIMMGNNNNTTRGNNDHVGNINNRRINDEDRY
jgi:hypothetical protein